VSPIRWRGPSRRCVVTRHAGERIVADGDIVAEVMEQALAAERIESRIEESQGNAGILIQIGDDPGPTRRSPRWCRQRDNSPCTCPHACPALM